MRHHAPHPVNDGQCRNIDSENVVTTSNKIPEPTNIHDPVDPPRIDATPKVYNSTSKIRTA